MARLNVDASWIDGETDWNWTEEVGQSCWNAAVGACLR